MKEGNISNSFPGKGFIGIPRGNIWPVSMARGNDWRKNLRLCVHLSSYLCLFCLLVLKGNSEVYSRLLPPVLKADVLRKHIKLLNKRITRQTAFQNSCSHDRQCPEVPAVQSVQERRGTQMTNPFRGEQECTVEPAKVDVENPDVEITTEAEKVR